MRGSSKKILDVAHEFYTIVPNYTSENLTFQWFQWNN